MSNDRVKHFVQQVQSKLNQHLLWRVLMWAGASGACCLVVVGGVYIWQGFAVPRFFYPLVASLSLFAAVGVWMARRVSKADASRFADRYFGLKDSVTSCRNFGDSGLEGAYFDLQAKQTQTQVTSVSPSSIPFAFPRPVLAVGLIFGAAAALMAFVGPSQAVQDRMDLEIAMLNQTSLLNEQLEELVEELDKEINDEEERKLVEPNKLREWVQDLRQTEDQKDALRQYAKLGQKLEKASARLEQKRDEQYLDRAAKELDKGNETKKLAQTLKQKKYDDAAAELNKMKPDSSKKLSERRKQLAKLKSAAKRMASAAKRNVGNKRSSSQKNNTQHQLAKSQQNSKSASAAQRSGKQARSAKQSQANDAQNTESQMADSQSKSADQQANENELQREQSVEQLVRELQQNLDDLEKQLADAELQEAETGESDPQSLADCEKCQGDAQKSLSKLASKLGRMEMKRKLQSRLGDIAKACSQGQSRCVGLTPASSQSLTQSPGAGGKKPGWGSNDARRNERDALQDNGVYSQLKGQKGTGPSLTALEEAEDGSGVSTAKGVAVSRTFQRQMESFVEREDVPDDVKNGVRNYFEMIHQTE